MYTKVSFFCRVFRCHEQYSSVAGQRPLHVTNLQLLLASRMTLRLPISPQINSMAFRFDACSFCWDINIRNDFHDYTHTRTHSSHTQTGSRYHPIHHMYIFEVVFTRFDPLTTLTTTVIGLGSDSCSYKRQTTDYKVYFYFISFFKRAVLLRFLTYTFNNITVINLNIRSNLFSR